MKRFEFGESLRSIRERKGLTIRSLAIKTGLSESLISQVERNKISPSIDTLIHLCDHLNYDVENLFREIRKKREIDIVRSGERTAEERRGLVYQSLASHRAGSDSIGAYLISIPEGKESGNEESGHPGEELGLILNGEALLEIGADTYHLRKGDSIAFSSEIPHRLKNERHEILEAVWVLTSPRPLS